MSVELTCRACGEEYDARRGGTCPACGAVLMPGDLKRGISILLDYYKKGARGSSGHGILMLAASAVAMDDFDMAASARRIRGSKPRGEGANKST